MITGDHAVTAEAIAIEAGIINKGETAVTDEELEDMTDEELTNAIKKGVSSILARIKSHE